MVTEKNRLIETVLLSTQKTCDGKLFNLMGKKIITILHSKRFLIDLAIWLYFDLSLVTLTLPGQVQHPSQYTLYSLWFHQYDCELFSTNLPQPDRCWRQHKLSTFCLLKERKFSENWIDRKGKFTIHSEILNTSCLQNLALTNRADPWYSLFAILTSIL